MTSDTTPKFTQQEIDNCKSWLLPDVSSARLIPTAEKEARLQKHRFIKSKQPKAEVTAPVDKTAGESIDIVEEKVEPITAEQLQAITDAAEKEGYDAGYQQGLAQGLEQGQAEGNTAGHAEGLRQGKQSIVEQCERLTHIVDALFIPLETEHKQLEHLLVDMVTTLARAVVQRELQADSTHITTLVDAALNVLPATADKFALYLNSQDVTLVEQHLHSIDKQFTYHIDDNLLPGGCRLETRHSVVDYSVETRLQQVIDDFLHKRFVNPDKKMDLGATETSAVTTEIDEENDNKDKDNKENKDKEDNEKKETLLSTSPPSDNNIEEAPEDKH
jgi:flagellar assembly protein FliH